MRPASLALLILHPGYPVLPRLAFQGQGRGIGVREFEPCGWLSSVHPDQGPTGRLHPPASRPHMIALNLNDSTGSFYFSYASARLAASSHHHCSPYQPVLHTPGLAVLDRLPDHGY